MTPVALTIAGSDPSGGAGLQADLKTFHQHGVYGTSAVTLLTVQNTQTVLSIRMLEPAFIEAQLDAVLNDIPPTAAKAGALGNAAMIELIATKVCNFTFPLVVDPVMVSKHGVTLLEPNAIEALRVCLLPHAFLVTPNIFEAAALSGIEVGDDITMAQAARALHKMGAKHVLIKGGQYHEDALDLLFSEGQLYRFEGKRLDISNTHGTGCVLSAAITANLALGLSVIESVAKAKAFVMEAIRTNPNLGQGTGPVNMHASC